MPRSLEREDLARQLDESALAAVVLEIAAKRWDEWATAGKPPIKVVGDLPKNPLEPVKAKNIQVLEDGGSYGDVLRLLIRSSVKSVIEQYDIRKSVKPPAIYVRAVERYMAQYYKASRGVSTCFELAAKDLRNDARGFAKQIKALSKGKVLTKLRKKSSVVLGLDGKMPPRRIVLEDEDEQSE